ncbi:MAG TPA: SCO family protein [Thermoanaerobaculia bacterium]|nr:SCO family protein [Thermoanaerobaculia bacterium]
MTTVFWRRGLLWGLLIASLAAIVGAAIWSRIPHWTGDPPPELGRVPDFEMTNRDGRRVGLSDLLGSPWIADFIFTRCADSCPRITERMARLEHELPPRLGARLVSFSVDPEHDVPPVLEKYAEKVGAPEHWWFLSGERTEVHDLIRNGFKLAVDAAPPPGTVATEPILHSTRFVLVDAGGRIRGYYDAFDESAMKHLKRDLEALGAAGR